MSMLNRLSRLVVGGTAAAAVDAAEKLTECYVACVGRATQLRAHADMAPQAYSEQGLRELADAEETQAERLRAALSAAGHAIPAVPATRSSGAPSHWARLVQDLEAHRISARQLRELAVHFAEDLPSTADLFDQLCREEIGHCERLRALIARSDPQALD